MLGMGKVQKIMKLKREFLPLLLSGDSQPVVVILEPDACPQVIIPGLEPGCSYEVTIVVRSGRLAMSEEVMVNFTTRKSYVIRG